MKIKEHNQVFEKFYVIFFYYTDCKIFKSTTIDIWKKVNHVLYKKDDWILIIRSILIHLEKEISNYENKKT